MQQERRRGAIRRAGIEQRSKCVLGIILAMGDAVKGQKLASATALHFQAHLGNAENCAAILDDEEGPPVDVDCQEAGVSGVILTLRLLPCGPAPTRRLLLCCPFQFLCRLRLLSFSLCACGV